MKNIRYSGVILDESSFKRLKDEFSNYIPTNGNWRYIGHHMTIKTGELPEHLKHKIDDTVELRVIEIGISEFAVAVKVINNNLSTNDIPHITLAVNTDLNAKPVQSNFIKNWNPISNQLVLTGKIQEIY